MTLKHKAFIQAVKLIRDNPKKAKTFLNDKRMTSQEKVIFMGFLSLRNFENQDVIDSLSKIQSSDQFVESQRHFCLGSAYNNLTQSDKAEYHLRESIKLNKFKDGIPLKMDVYQSLFTVYLNSFRIHGMEEMIKGMRETDIQTDRFKATVQYCEFALAVHKLELDVAKKLIPKMENAWQHLNEHQCLSYLLDCFDLYLYEDNFDECYDVLERMKRLRKFKNETHVKYMQSMLGFIREDAPIYLYEKDFLPYPKLYNQVQCIKALENGNDAAAQEAWSNLHKIAPQHYHAPYDYKGAPNLFSKALNKFKLDVKPISVPISFDSNLTKEEKLVQLLANANAPLQKEAIYQMLWEKEIDSKDDLKKLVKVVQRARDKFDVDIKSVKGAYAIKDKKAG